MARIRMPHLVTLCLALVLAATFAVALDPPRPADPPPDVSIDPVWEAVEHLERSYVRTGVVATTDLVAGALVAVADALAVDANALPAMLAEVPDAAVPDDLPAGYEDVWRGWERAVGEVGDPFALRVDILRGMAFATGDPRADVLVGVDLSSGDHYDDAFQGVGALTLPADGGLQIIQPFPGGPAARAGLRPGDVIVAVDGRPLAGLDADRVLALVRGPEGSSVQLQLERAGVGTLDVALTREAFKLASAASRRLGGGVGYLSVTRFHSDTSDEVRSQLALVLGQGTEALVLDLRATAAGSPTAAREVADEFLDGMLVHQEEDLDGNRIGRFAQPGGLAVDLPLVVLVDQQTVGAAELLAAALQDNGRAPLFGLTTAGNGLLHTAHPVGDDLAVVVMSGRWYTPAGRDVHAAGVEPDAAVPLLQQDRAAGFDRQLQTAFATLWSHLQGEPLPEVPDVEPPPP